MMAERAVVMAAAIVAVVLAAMGLLAVLAAGVMVGICSR